MSLLVVGLSHHSADLTLLERAALDADAAVALAHAARSGEHVSEAMALATCNRVEVYADVATFHGGLSDVGAALSCATGVPLDELSEHLYVHYEDRAVAHLFSVVCGLDSMAVGEGQILGQVRQAMRRARDSADLGGVLDPLLQQALRVGKRAHTETGLDTAGRSIVEAGLEHAVTALGATGFAELTVLVVGAGSMSALAATTVRRAGVRELAIANRTPERARRLAAELAARVVDLDDLDAALAAADIVISCTGARGQVVDLPAITRAQSARQGRPQAYVDLALPRDVDPAAGELPLVTVIDLAAVGHDLEGGELSVPVAAARDLVSEEVAEYLLRRRAEAVAPTVVALRARAAEVVAAELARLEQRRPDLDPEIREELRRTVNRVVDKLLHAPTVRVKELAGAAEPADYAAALRELFDLGPQEAVAVPPQRLDEAIDIGSQR